MPLDLGWFDWAKGHGLSYSLSVGAIRTINGYCHHDDFVAALFFSPQSSGWASGDFFTAELGV
jgi:hypothetical protein